MSKRKRGSIASLLLALCAAHVAGCRPADAPSAPTTCRPLGYDKPALQQLRSEGFEFEDPERCQRFAVELLECLGDPDPQLRDEVAYEGLATLLRDGRLEPGTILQLHGELVNSLTTPDEDNLRVHRPFAALALSEIARADRVEPLFSPEQRAALVSAAASYVRSVDDYRGFDEQVGWRHGVAHGADLLMQLAINPALDRYQLEEILDAVASQVVPSETHFYVYAESRRLSRPVLFVAMRGLLSSADWADWFARVGSPQPFESWSDVYTSQAGLAKVHNTRAFAQAIYVSATANDQAELDVLRSGTLEILRQLQ